MSPNDELLAYAADFTGDEKFELRVKSLATGKVTERTEHEDSASLFSSPPFSLCLIPLSCSRTVYVMFRWMISKAELCGQTIRSLCTT